jgi:hypothetical protein
VVFKLIRQRHKIAEKSENFMASLVVKENRKGRKGMTGAIGFGSCYQSH